MLRLDKVTKTWKDAATLSDHINLYGFLGMRRCF